jgi:hypothetical protein
MQYNRLRTYNLASFLLLNKTTTLQLFQNPIRLKSYVEEIQVFKSTL